MSRRDPEVGEQVIIHGGTEDTTRYDTVERLTKTMIVVSKGTRFQRDGFHREVGRDWSAYYLITRDDPTWESRARQVEVGQRKRNAVFWAKAVQEAPTDPAVLKQAADRLTRLAAWHAADQQKQEDER